MSDPLAYLHATHAEAEQTVTRLHSELWWIGNVTRIEAYAGDIQFDDPGYVNEDGSHTVTVTEAIQRGLLAGNPDSLSRRIVSERKTLAACEEILAVDGWEYDDAPNLADATIRNMAEGWGWTEETTWPTR